LKVKEKKLKQACSECNDKDRRLEIAKILSGVQYKTKQDHEDAIESFFKCKLSIEEIEQLAKPLRPDYRTNFNKSTGVF